MVLLIKLLVNTSYGSFQGSITVYLGIIYVGSTFIVQVAAFSLTPHTELKIFSLKAGMRVFYL